MLGSGLTVIIIAGLVVTAAAGLAAFAIAALIQRHAVAWNLMAKPNARSSHGTPTPSGGGLGIVAGGTIGGLFVAFANGPENLPIVGLSVLVALLGFFDDRRPIRAAIRLPIQFVLIGAMVMMIPATPLASALGLDLPLVVLLGGVTVAAVYWVNLFNFMDGIDGLAGAQAVFMLGSAVLLAWGQGGGMQFWWIAAIAAASLGFLLRNWPPAKIFMGDAGSTYLGFMIAYAALVTVAGGWLTAWQWLILGGLFLADATLTLARRTLRREAIFSAHRLHAYQHLARRWRSHRRVSALYLAVNLVLLLPLAGWAGLNPVAAPVAALAAYIALGAGLLWAGAGAPEEKPS